VRILLLAAATASLALGQVHFGVKAGVPLTDTVSVARNVSSGLKSTPTRFTIGPTFEVRLPWGIGIEADALYKNVNYQNGTAASTDGSAWQFPVLLKKRFSGGAVRPYLGIGPAFERLSDVTKSVNWFTSGGSPKTAVGGVIEGGFELHAGPLKISPEVRFTRWSNTSIGNLFRLNTNQAEFLLGVAF
jgi:outer membrane protein W